MQLCGSLSILWHCLSLGLEWKLTFSSPVATAEFSKFAGILSAALQQHYLLGLWLAQLEFITSTSFVLRLLIFPPVILIPACASSSPAFHRMYPAEKLNKQGDNIQLWCTPFPILNQSIVPCPVLTTASWPTYRFLRRQGRWFGIPVSLRIFHSFLWFTEFKALA